MDDLAEALLFLMRGYDGAEHINVGCGEDVSILELAGLVAKAVGYAGKIVPDPTKPDGTPRKLLDVSRLSELGWRAHTGLAKGLAATYAWYIANKTENEF